MNKIVCLCLVIANMICSFALAQEAPLVHAKFGPKIGTNVVAGPDAVVMKDDAGNDVLVVFYKLSNQRVGFGIGKKALDSGAIDWDMNSYIFKTTVMKADEFTPAPVMMNGVLYLFGREHINNKGHFYIYNSFTSLEDLKSMSENSSGVRPFMSLGIVGQEELGNIDAIEQNGKLMLTFLQREGQKHTRQPLSALSCSASDMNPQFLSCSKVSTNGDKFKDPNLLIPVTINGNAELLMMIRDDEKLPVLFHWDSIHSVWNQLYTIDKFMISAMPMSALEIDSKLHLYFKAAEGTHLFETSINTSELLSPFGYWADPVKVPYTTDLGVMAIAYQGRGYVFYDSTPKKCSSVGWDEENPCTEKDREIYYYSNVFVE